jgi:hypothetical protein
LVLKNTVEHYGLVQGFSNCGTHTTSDMSAIVEWYMGLVITNQRIKKLKKKNKTHTHTHHMHTYKY